MTGKIKRLTTDKGFGFIKPDDGGRDLFFHCSALQNSRFEELQEGLRVSFNVEQGEKGPRATEVAVCA